jgi:hypothetical protein
LPTSRTDPNLSPIVTAPAPAPSSSTLTPSANQLPAPTLRPVPKSTSTTSPRANAKNVFKVTLTVLQAALSGLPLPGKGVIDIVINLIKIAEVRTVPARSELH